MCSQMVVVASLSGQKILSMVGAFERMLADVSSSVMSKLIRVLNTFHMH